MKINNKYGYVRVSAKSQESNSSIESQKQQLIQNGIEEENIFVEVGSGANEIKNRSVVDISKLIGVSSPTIYKVLKDHLGYVSNRLVKATETKERKNDAK